MIPHFQSSPYTTAASSLLTILHHFDSNFPKNKVKEFEIWHECANLPTRGCSIYALARYAKQQGLNPKVVVKPIKEKVIEPMEDMYKDVKKVVTMKKKKKWYE